MTVATAAVGRAVRRQSLLAMSRNRSSSSSPRSTLAALSSRSAPSTPYSQPIGGIAPADNSLIFPSLFSARCFSAAPSIQPEIKLYQYHICPFCNITKSLLSYLKLDYESIEVNPLTKSELKPWSGDYKKVPIALIDEEQVNGSDEIVDSILNSPDVQKMLEGRWASEVTMRQFQESDNAQKWARFARDDLAALLYPNICSSLGDSYDAFGYVNDVESFTGMQKISIRSLGALAMYFAASKVKSKRGITDEKAALREALDKYERDGLQNGKLSYSSGLERPDLGDVATFGVLYSVRGLNAHNDAIQSRGGPVKEWYDRMYEQVIGGKAGQ